jgi:SAM-dependent methyltransferase
MSNPFVEMYAGGGWNAQGSGWGSQPDYNRGYRRFLERFLVYNRIQSVVDFGCGDWSFSRLLNWHGASYLGLDCVPSVIQQNKELYERGNVRFQCLEFGDYRFPSSDLLIVKDVLQHWSNDRVRQFLPMTRQAPFVLLVNDFLWVGENGDIPDGQYRKMDLTKPPFSEVGLVVFTFDHPPDDKVVFLKQNRPRC